MQDRIGPNRTGLGFGLIPWLRDKPMFGLGQPMADGLKFFFKEDYKPKNVDKILFTIAPAIMMTVMVVSAACIPWGGWRQTSRTYHMCMPPTFKDDAEANSTGLPMRISLQMPCA